MDNVKNMTDQEINTYIKKLQNEKDNRENDKIVEQIKKNKKLLKEKITEFNSKYGNKTISFDINLPITVTYYVSKYDGYPFLDTKKEEDGIFWYQELEGTLKLGKCNFTKSQKSMIRNYLEDCNTTCIEFLRAFKPEAYKDLKKFFDEAISLQDS